MPTLPEGLHEDTPTEIDDTAVDDSLEYGHVRPGDVADALQPTVARNLGFDSAEPPDEEISGVQNTIGLVAAEQQLHAEELLRKLQKDRPPGIEPDPSLAPPESPNLFGEDGIFAEYMGLYTQEADSRVDQLSTPDLLVIIRWFIATLGGPELEHTDTIDWETLDQSLQYLYQLKVNHDRLQTQVYDLAAIGKQLVDYLHIV